MNRSSLTRGAAFLAVMSFALSGGVSAQQPAAPDPAPQREPTAPSAPITALVSQLTGLFPRVQGEVLEVQGESVTLGAGRKDGARVGLEVELYSEGREIKHPKTGQVLGRAEQSLGIARITEAQEAFSSARLGPKSDGQGRGLVPDVRRQGPHRPSAPPGWRARGAGRGRDPGAGRATDRHRPLPGLHGRCRQRVPPGQADRGRGLPGRQGRSRGRPAVQVRERPRRPLQARRRAGRTWSRGSSGAGVRNRWSTALLRAAGRSRAASQGSQFSASGKARQPAAGQAPVAPRAAPGRRPRGWARTRARSRHIPLREAARFPFPVVAMDIAIAPKDKLARLVVSDGEKVYMYAIVDRKFEPSGRRRCGASGRVFSDALRRSRWRRRARGGGKPARPEGGLNSFIVGVKDGKPRYPRRRHRGVPLRRGRQG